MGPFFHNKRRTVGFLQFAFYDGWLGFNLVQWKNTGGLKQKHKKQPFSDASASHLSLVLWHV